MPKAQLCQSGKAETLGRAQTRSHAVGRLRISETLLQEGRGHAVGLSTLLIDAPAPPCRSVDVKMSYGSELCIPEPIPATGLTVALGRCPSATDLLDPARLVSGEGRALMELAYGPTAKRSDKCR